ncbi:uncharacterized protein ACO6RY_04702 [Pungitius sinensis]
MDQTPFYNREPLRLQSRSRGLERKYLWEVDGEGRDEVVRRLAVPVLCVEPLGPALLRQVPALHPARRPCCRCRGPEGLRSGMSVPVSPVVPRALPRPCPLADETLSILPLLSLELSE